MYLVKFNNFPGESYEFKKYLVQDGLVILSGLDGYPKDPIGGFKVYEVIKDNKTYDYVLKEDFSEYKLVWEIEKNQVTFSNDTDTYYTYFIADSDNFICQEVTTKEKIKGKVLLVDSGVGRPHKTYKHIDLYDEDGFYLYKIENNKKIETTAAEKEAWLEKKQIEKLNKIKEEKKNQINQICKRFILKGVELNNSKYSYTIEDQNNISNCLNLAIQSGLKVPYHADNENCRLFTKEEIIELYFTQELNLTHHTTYSNQLKNYVDQLQSIKDVENVRYGETQLTGDYLKVYNEMMEQAETILRAITQTDKEVDTE